MQRKPSKKNCKKDAFTDDTCICGNCSNDAIKAVCLRYSHDNLKNWHLAGCKPGSDCDTAFPFNERRRGDVVVPCDCDNNSMSAYNDDDDDQTADDNYSTKTNTDDANDDTNDDTEDDDDKGTYSKDAFLNVLYSAKGRNVLIVLFLIGAILIFSFFFMGDDDTRSMPNSNLYNR